VSPFLRSLLLLASMAMSAASSPTNKAPEKPPQSPGWVFSLLPKSLQKDPRLELTVITEMTPEGKKLPVVDDKHPAYYLAQSGGYRRTNDAPAGDQTLPVETIDAFIRRALATRGYHPASDTTPASLALVYTWGVHTRPPDDEVLSSGQLATNLLDRAALVGGEKFRQEFSALLTEMIAQEDAADSLSTRRQTVDGVAVEPVVGADQLEMMNPMARFRRRDPKNDFLVEQVAGDVYYVVISAYDHAAITRNQRVLLWRTRMTVGAAGVSQTDSLPTLIRSAAPYLGHEMTEPATLMPRTLPEGKVKLGPLIIKDEPVELPPAGNIPLK
jgi:hypothetical protein